MIEGKRGRMDDVDFLTLVLLEEEEDDEYLLQHKLLRRRAEEGCFNLLINAHLEEGEKKFREFFRSNPEQMNFVLSLTENDITKSGTNFVKFPISGKEKLALTLRYMATGESFGFLAFSFRISHSYINSIIKGTLSALCTNLMPIFIPSSTKESLRRNAV